MKGLIVRMEQDLHKEIKILAAKKNISMTELVVRAMKKEVAANKE